MPRPDALELARLLSAGQVNDANAERLYHEAVIDLAVLPVMTQARVVDVFAGQPLVSVPEGPYDLADVPHGVTFLGVVYDDHELSEGKVASMRSLYGEAWRSVRGTPQFFVREEETPRSVRLVPVPDIDSEQYEGFVGEPLGNDYPRGACVIFYTEVQQLNDAPPWLDLALALAINARAFAEESNVRDPSFASANRRLSEIFLTLLVQRAP